MFASIISNIKFTYCNRNANRLANAVVKKTILVTLSLLLSIITKFLSCFQNNSLEETHYMKSNLCTQTDNLEHAFRHSFNSFTNHEEYISNRHSILKHFNPDPCRFQQCGYRSCHFFSRNSYIRNQKQFTMQ